MHRLSLCHKQMTVFFSVFPVCSLPSWHNTDLTTTSHVPNIWYVFDFWDNNCDFSRNWRDCSFLFFKPTWWRFGLNGGNWKDLFYEKDGDHVLKKAASTVGRRQGAKWWLYGRSQTLCMSCFQHGTQAWCLDVEIQETEFSKIKNYEV